LWCVLGRGKAVDVASSTIVECLVQEAVGLMWKWSVGDPGRNSRVGVSHFSDCQRELT
jgi:hypothetical protein